MSLITYREIKIIKHTDYFYETEDIRFFKWYYNGSLIYSVDSNTLGFLKDIIDTLIADGADSLIEYADSTHLADTPLLYKNLKHSCVVAHLNPVPERVKKRDNILKLLY